MTRFLLFLLFSCLTAKVQAYTPYQMDSVARANLAKICLTNQTSNMLTLRYSKWVKFTITTHVNASASNRNYIMSIIDQSSSSEIYDLANIVTYDIRAKVYLTKRLHFLGRTYINGNKPNTMLYTGGLVYRISLK